MSQFAQALTVKKRIAWFVYHAYDARQGGVSKLRIESLGWDEESWPYLPSQSK